MDAFEYLGLTEDLVNELEKKLEPLAERMRQQILIAEKRYQAAILAEPSDLHKTYSMGEVGLNLASYMYKWRDQDAAKALDLATAAAEREYHDSAKPLLAEHERRVEARLKCLKA